MAESATWKIKTILSTILSNRCESFWPFNLKYERKTLHRPLFTYAMGRAIRLEIVENRSAETFLQDLRSEFAHKQQVSWIFLKQLQTTFYLVALHVVYLKSHLKSRETPESGLHSSRVLPSTFGDALLGIMSPPSFAVRNGTRRDVRSKSGMPCSLLIITLHEVNGTLPFVKQIYSGADVRNVLLMHKCSIKVE